MPFTSSEDEEEFTGENDAEDNDEEDEAAVGNDDSSEDEPLAEMKSPRKRTSVRPSYAEEDSDENGEENESSSDDDIPLSSLAKKPSPKKKAKVSKPVAKKKKAAPKKKAPPPPAKSSKSYEWASAALYGTDCDKGMLIQRLLCRWWYAITWPTDIPDKAPKYYDALEGFPGVYICSKGDNVGHIKDFRDQSAAPSFVNFAKKSSEELRDLLVTALSAQMDALIEADGEGTSTEKELKDMLKWAKKLNTNKAEKEAAKVLKSQKLELP